MSEQDNRLYEFEPFVLDAGSRILLKNGSIVRLTPKAFETLLVLVQNGVQVVDKERLLKEVWPDSFVEEGSLSRNIHGEKLSGTTLPNLVTLRRFQNEVTALSRR